MTDKLGRCDCEAAVCDESDAHIAGRCSDEAVIRIEIYGMKQNLCEDCYASTVSPSVKVIQDIRR